MTSFAVDPAALRALAVRIRAASAQARVVGAGPARSLAADLGDAHLTAAAQAFLSAWTPALHDLVDDADRSADAVDAVASLYAEGESALARVRER